MHQLKSLEDTIAAIATPLGEGGIGIIRLSGKGAVAIADKMFRARKAKRKPSDFENFMLHYGDVIRGREIIDEALLTVMRAPRSYTKEDMVEISSHGGTVSLRAILKCALDLGARLAEPGEFTKRAFLNGRMDLTQAEAVLDIIQSKTEAFLRVSTHQLKGELSLELEKLRGQLLNVYIEVEAIVNFPEDDIDTKGKKSLLGKMAIPMEGVAKLLASSEHGRILKNGIKIVICGKPNVGKSSLLNVLLKEPRAIVSHIAGTTRDTIEETAHIRGIPFQLVDTAGILEPRDLIEEEAVRRSHTHVQAADLVLFMLDGSVAISDEDRKIFEVIKDQNVLTVLNKSDLKPVVHKADLEKLLSDVSAVSLSALKRIGIEALEEAILEKVWHGKTVNTQGILISNLRHIRALEDCRDTLRKAQETLEAGLSVEFVSEEIKRAVNSLDAITGRNIDTDLLENIFSQFCIGK